MLPLPQIAMSSSDDLPSSERIAAAPVAAVSSPTLRDPEFVSDDGPVTPRTPSAPPPPPAPPAVTDADLRAYLSRKDTQHRLRNVVAGALRERATRDLVNELSARAQMAILEGDARPESLERMPAWVDGAGRNTVRELFKEEKEEREIFTHDGDASGWTGDAYDGGGDRDVEDGARGGSAATAADAAADAPDESSDATPDPFLLSPWLRSRVRKDPDARALLDLLAYKAKVEEDLRRRGGGGRGTTVTALNNRRVYRLRNKYEAEWQEYKRKRDAMVLAFLKAAKIAAVVALVVCAGFLVWLALHREDEARPVDDVPQLRPAPTASADPPPDIADPTQLEPPANVDPKTGLPRPATNTRGAPSAPR